MQSVFVATLYCANTCFGGLSGVPSNMRIEAYGIPEGVLVTDVASKSAAEKAGIKANYVITKIDGQSISSAEELTEKLNYYAVGETVPITYEYLKDDAYVEKTVDVTLMENPNANNK